VIGMVVRGDGEVNGVHLRAAQPVGDACRRRAGVDEDVAAGRALDQCGVTLADINEGDGELRVGRLREQAERSYELQVEGPTQDSSRVFISSRAKPHRLLSS
jgi:hypothetical protein